MSATTLTFSEDEAANILSQVTNPTDFLNIPQDVFKRRDWERDLKKLTSFELHSVTLAEYYKTGRIPRGLRVNLRPTLFAEEEEFRNDFEKVLNKCSLDLMVLTISRLQKGIEELRCKTKATEQQLQDCMKPEEFSTLKSSVDTLINKYRKDTEDTKRNKYLRDLEDYRLNRVYKWRDFSSWQYGASRSGRRHDPRSSSSSSDRSTNQGRRRPFRKGGNREPPGKPDGGADTIVEITNPPHRGPAVNAPPPQPPLTRSQKRTQNEENT
ncbi:uncharacterized protein [Engystomops pustulosus]|uniref:uncharacterized protein n=1 Tax=Engystomops pustulosus TaxID=76066 RepID=UPI003AFAEA03